MFGLTFWTTLQLRKACEVGKISPACTRSGGLCGETGASNQSLAGCFRSLLLVSCRYLCLAKALVQDLQPTNSGDAKFGGHISTI